MKPDKTIALCIPAYNAEVYLPRLLASAHAQLIPFDEILVYNDCSTDATVIIATHYGAKVISGDINRGCSYGKNILANQTSCNWIHFHDADDELSPNFTTLAHKWINENGKTYQVLLLNYKYVDAKSGKLLGLGNHNAKELHEDPLKYAIKNKIVNFGLYNRTAFLDAKGFDLDPAVLYNEDNALHQRLARHGLKFDYLAEITCINYRYDSSMSSANQCQCARANFHVLQKMALTHGDIYSKEIADQLYKCIASLGAAQDWDHIKKALSLCEQLGHKYSDSGNRLFNVLTRLNPYSAVWLREKMIRLFKPHLREK